MTYLWQSKASTNESRESARDRGDRESKNECEEVYRQTTESKRRMDTHILSRVVNTSSERKSTCVWPAER